jgi:hypothetical protein
MKNGPSLSGDKRKGKIIVLDKQEVCYERQEECGVTKSKNCGCFYTNVHNATYSSISPLYLSIKRHTS